MNLKRAQDYKIKESYIEVPLTLFRMIIIKESTENKMLGRTWREKKTYSLCVEVETGNIYGS